MERPSGRGEACCALVFGALAAVGLQAVSHNGAWVRLLPLGVAPLIGVYTDEPCALAGCSWIAMLGLVAFVARASGLALVLPPPVCQATAGIGLAACGTFARALAVSSCRPHAMLVLLALTDRAAEIGGNSLLAVLPVAAGLFCAVSGALCGGTQYDEAPGDYECGPMLAALLLGGSLGCLDQVGQAVLGDEPGAVLGLTACAVAVVLIYRPPQLLAPLETGDKAQDLLALPQRFVILGATGLGLAAALFAAVPAEHWGLAWGWTVLASGARLSAQVSPYLCARADRVYACLAVKWVVPLLALPDDFVVPLGAVLALGAAFFARE